MTLDTWLWIAQGLLAAIYGPAGLMKAVMPIPRLAKMMVWPGEIPVPVTRFIGVVELAGRDPTKPPRIRFNHLATRGDRRTLAAALAQTRRILRMPALARFAGDELAPGPACDGETALIDYARANGGSVYHPVGTCRMGADADAVVDARLRVHGVTGLVVADASVMPTIPAGNTNAPTVMIAERAAAWVLAEHDSRGTDCGTR